MRANAPSVGAIPAKSAVDAWHSAAMIASPARAVLILRRKVEAMPKLMSEEQLLELATNVLNFQHIHAYEDPRKDVAAYIISLLQQERTCVDIQAKLKKMRKDTFERGENRYRESFDVFMGAIRRTRGTEDWVRFHTKKVQQVA